MTWLAWRSQRLQLLVCVGVVAAVAVWLAISGAADHSALLEVRRACGGGTPGVLPVAVSPGASCMAADIRLFNANRWIGSTDTIVLALPGVLGLVLGTPIVAREIEHGTNRLAWTQSIGRTRWLVIKLLLAGLLVAAVVGAVDPLLEWWNTAVRNAPQIEPASFSLTGFVDVGYALFAFMLGAALGSVIRRTAWAIAMGVPLFVGFRFWVTQLRPDFAPVAVTSLGNPFTSGSPFQLVPSLGVTEIGYSSNQATSWYLNSGYVPDGHISPGSGQNWYTGLQAMSRCLGPLTNGQSTNKAVSSCAEQLKLHWVQQYQPASHFWELQTVETAIFVAAALVLCGITVLAVRRWRT